MASVKDATAPNDRLRNDDIGLERRLELFRLQVEIRDCEKRAHDLFLQNMIKGTSHLSLGQEAVAAGFGVAMRKGDKSFCTYRGHAHTLARGASMEGMLGELMLRDIGLMRGKGGSMHLTSVEHDVSSAPTRSSAPICRSPAARLGARNISAKRTCRSASLATARPISARFTRRSTSPRSGSCRSSSSARTISTWNTRQSAT